MNLAPGTRLGPYDIVAAIGAGGMGEVYRARDSRLDRDVALKILPASFASDPDRLMRFEREARALAALNHPNIAHIHGIEESAGTRALVMELVEGRDLSEVIAERAVGDRGAPRSTAGMPLDDALAIATQIAAALEAAHEQGIIHRDLKPANIKVREDGTVKVLDFGLAKALDPSASGATADPMNSPTMTSPALTQMGVILGTAAYMAPEQARGKTVDRRADVWAFGVVLYEMLTGRLLFSRDEVSDTLAAVLTVEPDLSLLPPSTPPSLRRLLARCLAKDRRQRLDSMAVARLDLEEAQGPQPATPAAPVAAAPVTAAPGRRRLGAVGLIAAGVALGAVAMGFWPRAATGPAGPPSLVAQIPAPPDTLLAFYDGFELSPDGSTLAFAARTPSGLRQIWLRSLDTGTARPIPGTDNGNLPFWSPDGRSVAFFADYKLKRVNVDGSGLQAICDVPVLTFISGSWGAGGVILFSHVSRTSAHSHSVAGGQSRIFKVDAVGGTPVALDRLGVGTKPYWLPDGRRFLYAGGTREDWGIRLAELDGTVSRLVLALDGGWGRQYAFGGGMIFVNRNEALVAQRFDDASAALVGAPVTIALDAGTPIGWLAVSSAGRRVVALTRQAPGSPDNPGAPIGRLTWVDRQGRPVGTVGDPAAVWTLRLAPDGQGAVVNLGNDLWLLRQDGRRIRLTDSGQNHHAVWSVGGQELIFQNSGQASPDRILRRGLAPGAQAEPLENALGSPLDWSHDGRWLLANNGGDIIAYDLTNASSTPWLATRADEDHARFAPDGRWVAYASNTNGRFEVYLRAFEGAGEPIPVSTGGGDHPAWRGDGRELFFLSPNNEVMSVGITVSGNRMTPGQPQKLFSSPLNDVARRSFSPYDVASDGQRFLLNLPDRPAALFFLQGLDARMGGP